MVNFSGRPWFQTSFRRLSEFIPKTLDRVIFNVDVCKCKIVCTRQNNSACACYRSAHYARTRALTLYPFESGGPLPEVQRGFSSQVVRSGLGSHSRKPCSNGKYRPRRIGRLSIWRMRSTYSSSCCRYRCCSRSRNSSSRLPR